MIAHTQFTTVCKSLPAFRALVGLLSPVTSFMAFQGCLSSEKFATDRASEVLVFPVCQSLSVMKTGEDLQLLWVRKWPCNFDFCENGSSGRWQPSQQQ